MKNKLYYRFTASVLLLVLVFLGYTIKFYPDTVKPFDSAIQNWTFSLRNDSMTSFLKFFTGIVNPISIIVIMIVLILLFIWRRWYSEAVFLAGNFILVSGILNPILKYVYNRSRPDGVHLVHETTLSFPSGHAATSMVVFLSLFFIFSARLKTRGLKTILAIILGLIVLIVGFSRIYLGVHYPTDIIGGYLLASGCVLYAYPYYDAWRFQLRFKGEQK